MRKVIAAAVLLAAFLAVAGPPTAQGALECTYDPSTGHVTIALDPSGGAARIEVGNSGQLRVGQSHCGGATVANTSHITIRGSRARDQVDIALGGGPFTGIHWLVSLGGGHDQVRVFGTPGRDRMIVGSAGIDLDPLTHLGPDVKLTGVESVLLNGLSGPDSLSGQGGGEDGKPTTIPLTLIGAGGNDVLTGGAGNDLLTGNDNRDVLDGKGGNDVLLGNKSPDVIRGGTGFDAVIYLGRTTPVTVTEDGRANDGARNEHDNVYPDVEKIVGGSRGDHLTGGPGPNLLIGAGGNDYLNGGGGKNRCVGGPGKDFLVHC